MQNEDWRAKLDNQDYLRYLGAGHRYHDVGKMLRKQEKALCPKCKNSKPSTSIKRCSKCGKPHCRGCRNLCHVLE